MLKVFLVECYSEVSRVLSYRHLLTTQHIFTKDSIQNLTPGDDESKLKNLDMSKLDPGVLRGFLQNGQPEEIDDFVQEYVNSLGGGKFNLAGSVIGAYTIQAITTTLYAIGVSSDQAPVYKAIIVIIIVAVQAPPVKQYLNKRAAKRAMARG